ncbi:hypothetical protein ACHAXN_008882 [Cyclotella atomus]
MKLPVRHITTAFCCIRQYPPKSYIRTEMSGTSDQPTRDWFNDGRDAAKRLKEELGLDTNQELGQSNNDCYDEVKPKDAREAAMESGRAAARALLDQMKSDATKEESKFVAQAKSENEDGNIDSSNLSTTDIDHFDLPSQKSHCWTICMVPPPTAKSAWSQLTDARRVCKDPGFYRWPPHANLLYPFIEPVFPTDNDMDKATRNERKDELQKQFMDQVALHLSKAAEQSTPFDVTIDSFGTFGGKSRGVMWADPKSSGTNDNLNDPLIHLQHELEKQFPMCKDQKKQGSFTPHVTISHYANITDALAAKEHIQSTWEPISFPVKEVYLLNRKGDDGQFLVAATIPLGHGSVVKIHDPPIRFPDMPTDEEDWMLEERMKMKDRRKRSRRR